MQQLLFLLFFFGAVFDDHVSVLFFYCKHNVSHNSKFSSIRGHVAMIRIIFLGNKTVGHLKKL